MPKNLLTDTEIRNAKPDTKDYRLRDGDGLFVLVARTGGKSFQFRYKIGGKGQTETLKRADSLADARREADRLRDILADGDDPKKVKKIQRAVKVDSDAHTFAIVSAAWMKARRKEWTADYADEVASSLVNHLSDLEHLPVSQIEATDTAPLLEAIEAKSRTMEVKVASRLHAIMDYAVERGWLKLNPIPRRRRKKKTVRHYPAVTDLAGIGKILRAARASDPCKGIARAHLLLVFTAQRVSEVARATWSEFDLVGGTWTIPRTRMKHKDQARGAHVIPLPPALLVSLREWRKADGDSSYVCPAPREPGKSITIDAVEKFYRRTLGLTRKHAPHSWRSSFSTICRDAGKSGEVVEAQLDHGVGNAVSRSYDRAKRLELRAALMRWYEKQLIGARDE